MLSIRKASSAALLMVPLVLSACFGGGVRTGDDVRDPINAVNTITASEWLGFSEQLRTSMMESGVLGRYVGPNGEPVPLMIGDFMNKTGNPSFETQRSIMYNSLTSSLTKTNQVNVLADAGGTGADIDRSLADAQALHGSDAYDKSKLVQTGKFVGPRLILSGSFISGPLIAEGFRKQADYAVDMRLLDVETGLSVWEDQVPFIKQGRRGPGSGKVIGNP